jgi:heterodisulfide reductase subunit B
MEYALYLGCIIPTEQYGYEISARRILKELDVEIKEMERSSCCGAPLRHINLNLTLYLSSRNLAIADSMGLDILVLCPNCHLALREGKKRVEDEKTMEKIKEDLKEEGLSYRGRSKIVHILDLLYEKIDYIRERVVKPIDLRGAAHYGCHLLRPSESGGVDNPERPHKMEEILRAIGLESREYPERLNCCGGPIFFHKPDAALSMAGKKMVAIQKRFDLLSTVCPYGQRMFDSKQEQASRSIGERIDLPVLYLTQLLGIAMGVDEKELGLDFNLSPLKRLKL